MLCGLHIEIWNLAIYMKKISFLAIWEGLKSIGCFLFLFFMWFETFQILMCELQIIWRAVLRLCSLHNKTPLKYIWLFMTLFYTKCALCLLMISNWFFMHRQARMKALQATFPDVQEDEEFKIGKRFNFPKPISEPPSPTSTRGMLYIH